MKAVIFDYWMRNIHVATIPNDILNDDDYTERSEQIEEYLSGYYGYHMDAINYMITDDDEPIYVYPSGCDELKTKPLATL